MANSRPGDAARSPTVAAPEDVAPPPGMELEHREDEPELVVHGPPRVERLRAAVETLVSGRGVRFDARAFPLTNRLEPIRTTSETSDDRGSGGGAPNGMISLPKPALEDDVCVVTPVVVAPRRRGFAPEGPAGPFGRLISDATTNPLFVSQAGLSGDARYVAFVDSAIACTLECPHATRPHCTTTSACCNRRLLIRSLARANPAVQMPRQTQLAKKRSSSSQWTVSRSR